MSIWSLFSVNGTIEANTAPCVTKWLHSSKCYLMYYIFKGMHCKMLAAELEKCLSFVSCACPHLCVLTPKLFSGIPAVLPTQGKAWVSPDNARAVQLTTINLQAFTSTFSVSSDPKSAEWLFYFSLIVAFLCNRTSKIDPVNWFLALSHSLEGRQEFECSWGFQQAGQLGNCHCFPGGWLLTYWKQISSSSLSLSKLQWWGLHFCLSRWSWLPLIQQIFPPLEIQQIFPPLPILLDGCFTQMPIEITDPSRRAVF